METLTETLPVPASDVLAVKSAQPLPPSPPVKPQAISITPLVPAPLYMVSATNVTMVIPASLASVTARIPCQDNAPDTSDLPCIDLLGGEILPSQLTCLSADQESKKLHPLDSAHQDLMDSLLPSPPLENVDTSELPMSNAVPESTMPQVSDFPGVAQALSGHSTAALLHAGPTKATLGDDIWTNSHPPPLVATSTAPTVPDRPPAAPDPVTGVTLPIMAAPMTEPLYSLTNPLMELFKPSLQLSLCLRPMPAMTAITLRCRCPTLWMELLIILMEITRSFMENGERIPFVLIWLFLIITVYCCILLWLESLLLRNVPLTS